MKALPSAIAELNALGIRPRKGLAQHFLVDPTHRARIVQAAELGPNDAVLEIGPGPGVLTDLLAQQAGLVVAVELDNRILPFLERRFADQTNVRIISGDILELDPGQLMREHMRGAPPDRDEDGRPWWGPSSAEAPVKYSVVANLPYYITGAAVRHLLEASLPPESCVLTVQREVAERMVAAPPHMSMLAVATQWYCSAEIVDRIPAGAFYPAPKVDSAVIRLRRRQIAPVQSVGTSAVFRVARAGFGQRRKQLRNSLASGLGLSTEAVVERLLRAGIAPQRRAETLAICDWGLLALCFSDVELA